MSLVGEGGVTDSGDVDDGPYKRIPLVASDLIVDSDNRKAVVTCIESWGKFVGQLKTIMVIDRTKSNNFIGSSIYIGTASGEILHFFSTGIESDPYIIASKQRTHAKKRKPVSQIIVLPAISRALVLSQSTTSVFTLPEFAPCSNVGSMREVNGLSRDIDDKEVLNEIGSNEYAEVTVFSKSAIRFVRVFGDSLKLAGNIDYRGVLVGVRRSSYALVANNESYDLIDLQNVRKIPLFPIGTMGGDEGGRDNELGETITEESVPEAVPEAAPEAVPEAVPETLPEAVPGAVSEQATPEAGTVPVEVAEALKIVGHEEGNLDTDPTGVPEEYKSTTTSGAALLEEVPEESTRIDASEEAREATMKLEPAKPTHEEDIPAEPPVESPLDAPEKAAVVEGSAVENPEDSQSHTLVISRPSISPERTPQPIEPVLVPSALAPTTSIPSIISATSVDSSTDLKTSSSPQSTTSATFPLAEGQPLTPTAATTKPKKQISTPVKPIILPVSTEEFLVTSGTSANDKAMGLVVNVDGEISRGTIAWPKYPSSVAIDYPFVAAVIDNQIQLHSLHDQRLMQTVEFPSKPLITTVLSSYSTPYTPLVDKISLKPLIVADFNSPKVQKRIVQERDAATKISICSSPLFAYTVENGVECLIPAPRFINLEKLVLLHGRIDDVYDEMERMDFSTELAVTQLQYLNLLIGLYYLKHAHNNSGQFDSVTNSWLTASLDPRIIVFVFDKENVKGEIWVFNGVKSLIDNLQKEYISAISRLSDITILFLTKFYKEWFKKREMASLGLSNKEDVFKSLELSYLSLLIKCEGKKKVPPADIYYAIDNEIISATTESIQLLKEHKKFIYLSHLFNKLNMPSELLSCWKQLLLETSPSFPNGEETMANYLINQCEDEQLVWEYGAWLVQTYPRTGIKVFTSPDLKVKIDESQVVDVLKSMNNDEAWRQYLKYLVYDKKRTLFAADLAAVMMDDIIDRLRTNNEVRKSVLDNYNAYRSLPVPKISYIQYLQTRLSNVHDHHPHKNKKKSSSAPHIHDEDIVKLRLELMKLLDSTEDFDPTSLMHISVDEPDTLLIEQCVVFGRLGIHEQCLDILCTRLADYKTAIDYCIYGRIPLSTTTLVPLDVEIQKDLFRQLLLRFLKIPESPTRITYTRILLEQWGNRLDISVVLSHLPDSWPTEVVSGYLSQYFKRTMAEQNMTSITRSLARSENLFISKQLQELNSSIASTTKSDI